MVSWLINLIDKKCNNSSNYNTYRRHRHSYSRHLSKNLLCFVNQIERLSWWKLKWIWH